MLFAPAPSPRADRHARRRGAVTLAAVALAAAIGLAASPAVAASATWSPPVDTTGATGQTVGAVTAPNGTITTVVEDYTTGIMAVSSTDAGATWQTPAVLGSGGDYAFRATIGMTSTGLLAIAWVEEAAGVRSIQIVISADGGATWSSPTALPTVLDYVDDPSIGSSSALGFTVVWTEDTFDKLSSSSTDGGLTWSASEVVTEGMNSYGSASLAAVGASDIVVVYQEFSSETSEFSIQSRRSTNGGLAWQSPVPVAPAWSGSLSNGRINPVVSPAPGSLVAFWSHGLPGGGDALFAATSTDSGATWGPVIEVSVGAGFLRDFAPAVVDASTVGVVWHQQADSGAEAFYAEVELGAVTASTPVSIDLSSTSFYDRLPTLTVFGSTRVATWLEEDRDDQVSYRSSVSCDGGATWRPSETIAAGADVNSGDAVAALSGTVVTAFWSEFNDSLENYVSLASSIDDPCLVPVAIDEVPELAATGTTASVTAALVLGLTLLVGGASVVGARRATMR